MARLSAAHGDKVWIALGLSGLAARFVLAAISIGSNDAFIWLGHARALEAFGLRQAFESAQVASSSQYNHPPLMGYWALLAGQWSHFDQLDFSRILKLPGLLAELVSAALVYSIWKKRTPSLAPRALAAYGASLPAIFVSGYHCNTDCLYAMLALLAVWLMEDRKRPFWSGVALALALNVKLLPIFLGPALLSRCRTWRAAGAFCAGAALAIVPYAPFLWTSAGAMYTSMVKYNSLQVDWGVMAILNVGGYTGTIAPTVLKLRTFVVDTGRYWLLAIVLVASVLNMRRPKLDGYELGALVWALFLVLTPGFGVQYTVCVVPLLFSCDLKRAALYSLYIGVMLFCVYTLFMAWAIPLSGHVQYYPMPVCAVYFGIFAWLTLLGFTLDKLRVLLTRTRAALPVQYPAAEPALGAP